MEKEFLKDTIELFRYYELLGRRTLEQVADADLNQSVDGESNSLAIIVKHLWGNMLSRWTDFLDSDGEKPWRERDAEFEVNAPTDREQVMEWWKTGWDTVIDSLTRLKPKDLERTIYIRAEAHSVHKAILRQLGHYSYHVGQMVYLGKQLKGSSWTSLSIARGESEAFNARKFKSQ